MVRYLRNHQNEDGGWGLHIEVGPGGAVRDRGQAQQGGAGARLSGAGQASGSAGQGGAGRVGRQKEEKQCSPRRSLRRASGAAVNPILAA